MLQEEYARLAKSVENISKEQAEQIVGTALEKLRIEIGAMIIDVWTCGPGEGNIDVLQPFTRKKDGDAPEIKTKFIALTSDQRGLLSWIAEYKKALSLDGVQDLVRRGKAVDRIGGEEITGRFLEGIYSKTQGFAGVLVENDGELLGILTAEYREVGIIKNFHISIMEGLAGPTGLILWKIGIWDRMRKHTAESIENFKEASGFKRAYRTGFIARPFRNGRLSYVSDKIEQILKDKGVAATTYRGDAGVPVALDMLKTIRSVHFGIADVSQLNPNVLFELGVMIAMGLQCVILQDAKDESRVPFDIGGFQYYKYAIENENIYILYADQSRQTITIFLEKLFDKLRAENKDFREARSYDN
jgi:hypothetical protein